MSTTSPTWPRCTLFVLQGLQLLSLAPWLMMAALSFMAFDAPGSENNKLIWAFVLGMWSYPLWLLAAGIISWILLLKFQRRVGAVVLGAIFTLPAIVFLGWVVFLFMISRIS